MVNADVWYAQAAQVLSFLHENGLSMSGQEDIMSLSSSGGSNSMRAPLSSIDWTQQQQPVTGSQDATQTNIQSPMARIVLIRQPNSHVFQNRTIFLEPGKEVKIGRSVARARVNDNNGIFDCKVLSRNHAIVWYTADGSFYVKVNFSIIIIKLMDALNRLMFLIFRIWEAVTEHLLTINV